MFDRPSRSVLAAVFLVPVAGAAPADEVADASAAPMTSPAAPGPEWRVFVGAGARYKPEYEGGDEMEISPVPFVGLSYGRLELDPGGLDFSLVDMGGLKAGVALGYGGGRDPDDLETDRLDGLDAIDDSVILGFGASYDFGLIDGYLEADRYLGGSEGTSVTFGARASHAVSRRFELFADLSVTASDDAYMQSYFGVSGGDAARSGLAEYDAEGGLRRADLEIGGTYALNERMFLRGEIGVGQLLGDAEDSPVTLDSTQPSVALYLGYRF